jgi:predicted O-linked N-acetylglucosamine transferase (SPINDLY family)
MNDLRELLRAGRQAYRENRYAEARDSFERAAQLAPDSAEALFELASALDRLRRWPEALPLLERARRLAPDNERVWLAYRSHLLLFQRHEEAFEDFRAFEPRAALSAAVVIAGLLSARIAPGTAYEDRYLPLALEWRYGRGEAGYAGVALAQAEYFDVSRASLKRLHETYNLLRQEERMGAPDLAAPHPRQPGRLRVGYLSGDFREHVMGRILLEVLSRHDRGRFELHAFSLAQRQLEDSLTDRLRACCDEFTRLDDLDNPAAARKIAAAGLDLLVDLMGHSGGSRPGILLFKPAPVIATHLGSHGPVGLQQVDFKLSDAELDLPDAADWQIERPLPMEGCVLPLRRVVPAPGIAVTRETLELAPSAFVFGVFVSLLKLSPRCLRLWRAILERVPEAVLLFSPRKESERDLYLRRLESFGISPERVAFVPWTLDDAVDRARYRVVDAVLDTMPYTGGDTSAAALDMAVPVVTRVGERAAERMTWSLLAHLGVTDTAARNDEQYVAIACRLAREPEWRNQISAAIAERLPRSGLTDFDLYARRLEAAFERAVELKAASARG